MPNHFHGIINIIVGADPRVCPDSRVCPDNDQKNKGQSQGIAPTSALPDMIKRFKSLTTYYFTGRASEFCVRAAWWHRECGISLE
jgi:hypothetical protein